MSTLSQTAIQTLRAIPMGELDEVLKEIIEAARDRGKAIARIALAGIRTGDKVQLTGGRQYLVGVTGVVEKVNPVKIVVRIDPGFGYRGSLARPGALLTCPPSILKKVA